MCSQTCHSFSDQTLTNCKSYETTFHSVFSTTCAHKHVTALVIKHWPIAGAVRQLSIEFFSTRCAHKHVTALVIKHWPIAGVVRQLSIEFFSTRCAHKHVTALVIKHWPIAGAVRAVNQTMNHHAGTYVPYFFYENMCLQSSS
jgi:hypothetical protein